MNEVIKDPRFELNEGNFTSIKMPNEQAFYDDDRETTEKQFWRKRPCMQDCKVKVEILGRARALDVTPDPKAGPKVD